jgi:hypothetical protein
MATFAGGDLIPADDDGRPWRGLLSSRFTDVQLRAPPPSRIQPNTVGLALMGDERRDLHRRLRLIHRRLAQSGASQPHIPYNYLLFPLPVALGYSSRTHRAYAAKVEEEQRLRAREAVNEERNRIARELHDVVAHRVSIMVLQATAGSRIAPRDPGRAAEALDVIQRTGREALDNLRRMVGVLRRDQENGADHEPQPGLGQLETLVDQVRHAGVPVDLEISGEAAHPRQVGWHHAKEASALRPHGGGAHRHRDTTLAHLHHGCRHLPSQAIEVEQRFGLSQGEDEHQPDRASASPEREGESGRGNHRSLQ